MSTPYQAIATIADRTNVPVRLPYGSKVIAHEVTPDRATLVYQRNRITSTRSGMKSTPLGIVALQATRNGDRTWALQKLEISIEDADTFFSTGKSPEDQRESYRWALMCYRPGTDRFPMDGAQHDTPTIR